MKTQLKSPQNHPAYKRYLTFNKDYPNIKQEYKKFDNFYLKSKAKNNKDDDGIYVSMPEFLTNSDYIANNFINEIAYLQKHQIEPAQMNKEQLRVMRFINAFNMFLAWRMSLSIYRIDEDIFNEMIKSSIPKDTPSNIFRRLPDFCVYIDFPRLVDMDEINPLIPFNGLKVKGFWAYLDKTFSGNGVKGFELKICADLIEHELYADPLSNVSMIIKDGLTVEESADLVFDQYVGHSEENTKALAQSDKIVLFNYLSILLWLCAEEPDISNIIGEPLTSEQVRQPKYGQKKNTGQFIPPSNPRIYNLGQRLGGEIRNFKEDIRKSSTSKKATSKRPHIRKGHWHGYWVGTGQNKKFIIKWLPAVFINAPTNN